MTRDQVAAEAAAFPEMVHPLARTTRTTAARASISAAVGSSIQGTPEDDSKALFGELLAHMISLEFTYTHDWAPGDILVSDNRCSLHRPTERDTERYGRRRLHRLIMLDDTPPV